MKARLQEGRGVTRAGSTVILLAAAGLIGAHSASAVSDSDLFQRVTVSAHGQKVHASPGSSQRQVELPDGTTEVIHGDAFSALDLHGHLAVRRGQQITIVTAERAGSIRLRALSHTDKPRSGTVSARPLDHGGRRWAVRLPRRIARDADRVSFDVSYVEEHAYTNFEAGIRVVDIAKLRAAAARPSRSRRACVPSGTHVLARRRPAVVFSIRHGDNEYVEGCYGRYGRRVALDTDDAASGIFHLGPFRIAGHFVAFAAEDSDPIAVIGDTWIRIYDLKSGHQQFVQTGFQNFVQPEHYNSLAQVDGFVLNAHGSVAAIVHRRGCENTICPRTPRSTSDVPGSVPGTYEVFKAGGSTRSYFGLSPVTLDQGVAIDPRSLRLRGSTLTWINAGQKGTAELR